MKPFLLLYSHLFFSYATGIETGLPNLAQINSAQVELKGSELKVAYEGKWTVKIYDMRGRLLWERNDLKAKGIQLDPFEKGRYLVKVEYDQRNTTLFFNLH